MSKKKIFVILFPQVLGHNWDPTYKKKKKKNYKVES